MQEHPTTPDPQQAPQPIQQPSSQPVPQSAPQPPYTPTFPPTTPTPPTASTPQPYPPLNAPNAAQQQPPQAKSNRKLLLIGGGIGCGVLLMLCMCAGLLTAIAASGGNTSVASGSSPTAPQQQSPTPAPTSTPNLNAGAAAYASVVSLDGTTMGDDLNAVSDTCGSGQDLSACRDALVTVREDSTKFLNDLDAHPAPPCLADVDKPLRSALNDIHKAAQEVIDGIDNYDVSKIDNGTALMKKATAEINTANDELDKASCS